jgi:hypothetical protein
MGADGWIYLFDADKLAEAGLDPSYDFRSAHLQDLQGRRIWTVYWDTEGHSLNDESLGELPPVYAESGALIDEWMVWT